MREKLTSFHVKVLLLLILVGYVLWLEMGELKRNEALYADSVVTGFPEISPRNVQPELALTTTASPTKSLADQLLENKIENNNESTHNDNNKNTSSSINNLTPTESEDTEDNDDADGDSGINSLIPLNSTELEDNRTTVCVFIKNFRQAALFTTRLVLKYTKNHNYRYELKRNINECKWQDLRVTLIPHVKCCVKLSDTFRRIKLYLPATDVIIITGDEYCGITAQRVDFRQYYGSSVFSKGYQIPKAVLNEVDYVNRTIVKAPLYMPLGTRMEFRMIEPDDFVPSRQRSFLFNFLGSLTSKSRAELSTILESERFANVDYNSSVTIAERWRGKIKEEHGYVLPEEYRSILLNSKFTLCPVGHNPEAYRIYEACEAASIPIMVIGDNDYVKHSCRNAFEPFISSGAPFVFLRSWSELLDYLETVKDHTEQLAEQQRRLQIWYKDFMTRKVTDFHNVLEYKNQKRLQQRAIELPSTGFEIEKKKRP